MVFGIQLVVVACFVAVIYMAADDECKPKVPMLGVAMFGALIYAHATYVPKSERIAQANLNAPEEKPDRDEVHRMNRDEVERWIKQTARKPTAWEMNEKIIELRKQHRREMLK